MGGWQHTGAFVIQVHPETDVEAGRFSGRVEHVASGRCTHFQSSEQLLAFVDRVLKEARVTERSAREGADEPEHQEEDPKDTP